VATLILVGCYFVASASSPSVPQEVKEEIVVRVINKVVERSPVTNPINTITEGIPNTGSLVDSGAGAFPIGEREGVRVIQSRAPRAPELDTVPEPASVSSADSEALTGSGNPFWDCFKRLEYKGVDPGEDRWLENAVERSRAQDRGFNINEAVYNTYIFAGDVFTWLKKKCFRPRRHVDPKPPNDSKGPEKAKEELSAEELREQFDRFMDAKAKAKPTFAGPPKAESEANGLNIDDIPAGFDPSDGDGGGGPPDSNPFLWIVLLIFLFSFVKFILTP